MFTKIRGIKARHLFCEGQTIYLCACNLRPELFAVGITPAMAEAEGASRVSYFDQSVNTYCYYNCINSETGRRVAFYVKEE